MLLGTIQHICRSVRGSAPAEEHSVQSRVSLCTAAYCQAHLRDARCTLFANFVQLNINTIFCQHGQSSAEQSVPLGTELSAWFLSSVSYRLPAHMEYEPCGEREWWLDFNFESENNILSNKMLRNIFQPRLTRASVHMWSLCGHQLLTKRAVIYWEATRVYGGVSGCASGIWNWVEEKSFER